MRLSINVLQVIAVVWTAIAILLALTIVIGLLAPTYSIIPFPGIQQPTLITPGIPWQLLVLMFFLFLLVMIGPAYLLLFLWHRLSKSHEHSAHSA